MHVCYISLYHIIYPIIDLPYIYIYILPYYPTPTVKFPLQPRLGSIEWTKWPSSSIKATPRDEAEVTLGNSRWNPWNPKNEGS